jgi:hypothetical protein
MLNYIIYEYKREILKRLGYEKLSVPIVFDFCICGIIHVQRSGSGFTGSPVIAHVEQQQIIISNVAWKILTQKQQRIVIAHEMCHVCQEVKNAKRYPNRFYKKHGTGWSRLMIRAGHEPNEYLQCTPEQNKLLRVTYE